MPKRAIALFSSFFILFFAAFSTAAHAQTPTQEVLQKPVEKSNSASAVAGPSSGGCGTVVEWAGKITAKLKVGGGGPLSGSGWDNLTQALKSDCGATTPPAKQGGQYWCTDLVIDAYTLAGIKVPRDLVAVSLYKKMKALPGFGHAGPSGAEELKKVKPGYAIAFGKSENDGPGGHIGIVKSINVDERGNGKIVTYEANSSATSHTWPIVGGKIGGSHKPVLGFAGSDKGGGGTSGGGSGNTTSCTITKVGNPKTPPPPLPPDCNTGGTGAAGAGGGGAPGVSDQAWQTLLSKAKQYGARWGEFLNAAKKVAAEEDYPLAVIVAQGAHESAHGTSNFAKQRNNFFGFQAYDSSPNSAKGYPSPEGSIRDYVKLIKGGNNGKTPKYKEAYASRNNPRRMVELIKAAGYATDPNYVNKVTNMPEFKLLTGN